MHKINEAWTLKPWISSMPLWKMVGHTYPRESLLISAPFLAPSCAEKQLELMKSELESRHLVGSTAWLAEGLAIQESQYVLQNPTGYKSRTIL
jgi:hypothetical protein